MPSPVFFCSSSSQSDNFKLKYNNFPSLELLSLWGKKKIDFGFSSWPWMNMNIKTSIALSYWSDWTWTAQPRLVLIVVTAAACHDQISVKPMYKGTFSCKQPKIQWMLLTQRHTLCLSCNTDPALWNEWDPSTAMRKSLDNNHAMITVMKYVSPALHPSCCTDPPGLLFRWGYLTPSSFTHWTASGPALVIILPLPCSGV